MRKLAAMDRQYHLAVSLHAPTEALRNELVPINEKVGLAAVMEAADAYFRRSGRQVTFEYVLLRGINDRPEDAAALAGLLRGAEGPRQPDPVQPGARACRSSGRRPRRSGGSWGSLRARGRQRERPEDQGARDRRGLRPAPAAVGRASNGAAARRRSTVGPSAETVSESTDDRGGPVATGETPGSSNSKPATPTSG